MTRFADLAPCRSLLSVPASNARALDKARGLPADVLIIDLEDSVAEEMKEPARAGLAAALEPLAGRRVLIRINGLDTAHAAADLAVIAGLRGVDGVVIPKVNHPRDCEAVRDDLDQLGGEGLALWAMMETPKAVINAAAIAEAAPGVRLAGMIVGLNDLRKALRIEGAGRTHLGHHLAVIVLAARAAGLTVIDSVSNDFNDLAAFAAECADGKAMGFDGKMLIHPAQIAPANTAFSPSQAALAEATAIVAAFAAPEAHGKGAIRLDGRMVERLHLAEAERLLALAATLSTRD